MRQIAEFVAVLACALFTGAAIYINLVEHPARMQCGVELAATEFAPSYRRATVMQAACAAVGLLSSLAAWLAGASFWWLVAGVLLGSVIPFTLIVILPTNKRLLSPKIPAFHPRVAKVELLSGKSLSEPGVSYRCHLSVGKHTCVEKDIEIVPMQKLVTVLPEDTFGISKVLPDYVVETTLHRVGQSSTKIEISHYYSTSTLKAKLLNLLARRKIARDTLIPKVADCARVAPRISSEGRRGAYISNFSLIPVVGQSESCVLEARTFFCLS